MRYWLWVLFVAAAATAAQAQTTADWNPASPGIGLMLGVPLGVTGKVWLDPVQAVDGGAGVDADGHFELNADYLFHGWGIFPQLQSGRLAAYAGLGGRVDTGGDSQGLGLRIPIGVSYMPNASKIELYAEVTPVFVFTNDTGALIEGDVGFRFYFYTRPPAYTQPSLR